MSAINRAIAAFMAVVIASSAFMTVEATEADTDTETKRTFQIRVGEPFSFTWENYIPMTTEMLGGSLPDGLEWIPPTIVGTPTSASSGFFSVLIMEDSIYFMLEVFFSVSNPETFSTVLSGEKDTPFSWQMPPVGGYETYVVGILPAGLSWDNTILSGTPTESGSWTFSIEVRDPLSLQVYWVYVITLSISGDSSDTFTFTLEFDARGGTGGPDSITETVTDAPPFTMTIPTEIPSKGEISFIGWSESPANDATFNPGDDFVFSNEGTATLYAVWDEIAGGNDGGDTDDTGSGIWGRIVEFMNQTVEFGGYTMTYAAAIGTTILMIIAISILAAAMMVIGRR